MALLMVGVSPGCHRKPKVIFERPPASASVPEQTAGEPEPAPGPETRAPADPGPSPLESGASGSGAPPRIKPPTAPKPEPRGLPPPPPSLGVETGQPDEESIRATIQRVEAILRQVRLRSLTAEQREQEGAVRGFLVQARAALAVHELRRAGVLADKGLVLVQDVERSSR
jgi:hypothetical protein